MEDADIDADVAGGVVVDVTAGVVVDYAVNSGIVYGASIVDDAVVGNGAVGVVDGAADGVGDGAGVVVDDSAAGVVDGLGVEDELYNLEPFLAPGITLIDMDTKNTSANDLIFLSILSITAQASVGEICGDGIDNDKDGLTDEGCGTNIVSPVAGELVPLNTTALFISTLSSSMIWMAPTILGIAGVGVYIKSKKN